MTDIVKLLRLAASHRNPRGAASLTRAEITNAADEIERLRAAEAAAYERAAKVSETLHQSGNRGHANFVATAIRKLADD